jgi:Antitoxin VbhA
MHTRFDGFTGFTGFDTLEASTPPAATTRQDQRRAQFAQANASLALEGLALSAEEVALQTRIVLGEISSSDAIDWLRRNLPPG